MKNQIALSTLLLGLVLASPTWAGDRTVTLAVQNMYCVVCPFTVKKSLEAVPGVKYVAVSYASKTAVVVYDDSRTKLTALMRATTDAGYPSSPKG